MRLAARRTLTRLRRDADGAAAIEYALIGGLMGIAVILAFAALTPNFTATILDLAAKLAG